MFLASNYWRLAASLLQLLNEGSRRGQFAGITQPSANALVAACLPAAAQALLG